MIFISIYSPSTRKRQLPDIPTAQLHANREKGLLIANNFLIYLLYLVSQDLYEKATQIKLRLQMQSTNDKSLLTQRSFDHTDSFQNQISENRTQTIDNNSRKSMIDLSSSKRISTTNLKEKPRIPIIRDKSAPNPKTTITAQNTIDTDKTKTKPVQDKYRKNIKKRRKDFILIW